MKIEQQRPIPSLTNELAPRSREASSSPRTGISRKRSRSYPPPASSRPVSISSSPRPGLKRVIRTKRGTSSLALSISVGSSLERKGNSAEVEDDLNTRELISQYAGLLFCSGKRWSTPAPSPKFGGVDLAHLRRVHQTAHQQKLAAAAPPPGEATLLLQHQQTEQQSINVPSSKCCCTCQ